jgi:ABC-type antimicrobial peptide transport system permease subunit
MARTSFTLVILWAAGGMALGSESSGFTALFISYSVSQRTREIGIRMALGAERENMTALFVRDGLRLAGVGIACGLVASFATMRLMSSLLFNVSPADPVTYGAITIGFFATVYLACYLPSRRAVRPDGPSP